MTDLWEAAADHGRRIDQLVAEIAQINERLDELGQEIRDHRTGRDGLTPYRPHEE